MPIRRNFYRVTSRWRADLGLCDLYLRPPIYRFMMLCVRVEMGKYGAGLCRHMADRVVRAHEVSYGVDAVQPHQGGELGLLTTIQPQDIDVAKSWNAPGLNGGNDFQKQDALVGRSVLGVVQPRHIR